MRDGLKMKHPPPAIVSIAKRPSAKGYAAGISALGVLPTHKSDFLNVCY
jgi:hypothetical protein